MQSPQNDATTTIHPSPEVLARWAERLTTPSDVWYWDDSFAAIDTQGQQLLTRQEYLAAYAEVEYSNAYWHWRMPKHVQIILVTDPNWIGSLSDEDRSRVLAKQVELDRGMMFPLTHFDAVPSALKPYVVGEKIVISRAAWLALSQADQFTALEREMLLWDDADCFPIPAETLEHIRAIANAYGDEHGTNCLSTTAYCITGREELRRKWMFQPEFHEILDQHGFQQTDETEATPGDVIAFFDNGTLVHAAWCLGDDRIVNKNGQSMFNPVRIVNRAMLNADWESTDPVIYRQSSPTT